MLWVENVPCKQRMSENITSWFSFMLEVCFSFLLSGLWSGGGWVVKSRVQAFLQVGHNRADSFPLCLWFKLICRVSSCRPNPGSFPSDSCEHLMSWASAGWRIQAIGIILQCGDGGFTVAHPQLHRSKWGLRGIPSHKEWSLSSSISLRSAEHSFKKMLIFLWLHVFLISINYMHSTSGFDPEAYFQILIPLLKAELPLVTHIPLWAWVSSPAKWRYDSTYHIG